MGNKESNSEGPESSSGDEEDNILYKDQFRNEIDIDEEEINSEDTPRGGEDILIGDQFINEIDLNEEQVITKDTLGGGEDILIEDQFIDEINRNEEQITTEEVADQQDLHEFESFSCQECPRTFPDRDQLGEHILVHAQLLESLYRCDQCNSVFRFSEEIITHIQTKHKSPYLKCKYCYTLFKYKRCFNKHLKSHRLCLRPLFVRRQRFARTYSRLLPRVPFVPAPRPRRVAPPKTRSKPGPSRAKNTKRKIVKPEPKKQYPANLRTYSKIKVENQLFESTY